MLRAFAESRSCLALTQEVLARPGIRAAIDEVGTREPPRPPGPDRRQRLRLLAG